MTPDLNPEEKKTTILVILALVLVTLAIYWPVQKYEFINYDDQMYVTDKFSFKDVITLNDISSEFTDFKTGMWHPLTMLSHMLDWQLFGGNAGGHHWTNVIIHIFNTILLFLLLESMTGYLWRSAMVAALFAIHPINVESVAWIAERKNVLSTFFWILTMLSYVWYVRAPNWKRYLLVLICFALGLMSKPMLVTLPFVLLLMDYWPLNRTTISCHQDHTLIPALAKKRISFLILEKIPLFFLTALTVYVSLYTQKSVDAVASLNTIPLVARVGNAIVSYGIYINKMFWPADLAVIYHFVPPLAWQVAAAAAILIIISTIACKYFFRHPYLAVGWFWYLGTMVPVIGFVQIGSQSMADRYAYVPFVGLFVMLVWGMGHCLKDYLSTKVIAGISGFILILLITVSSCQVRVWQNSFTLFSQAVKATKKNFLAHRMLAGEFAAQNNLREARHHYRIVLSIDPLNYTSLVRIASVYSRLGEKAEAMDALKTAIKIRPGHIRAQHDLFVLLMQMGKTREAEEILKQCLRTIELSHNKDNLEIRYNFGNTLVAFGHYDKAIIQYNEALRIQPQNAFVHYALARVLLLQGKTDEALEHVREAVRLKPQWAEAHHLSALILQKKGLAKEANRHHWEAIRIIMKSNNSERSSGEGGK